MQIIITILLVIIVVILAYYLIQQQQNVLIPLPNTFSNAVPSTTLAPVTTVPLVPVEVLADGYPLEEEYYYDPYYFYDPYWWWGGWYGNSSTYNYPRQPSSGDVTHGEIHTGGRIRNDGGRIGSATRISGGISRR